MVKGKLNITANWSFSDLRLASFIPCLTIFYTVRLLMFLSYTTIIFRLKTMKVERRRLTNTTYKSKGSMQTRWVLGQAQGWL